MDAKNCDPNSINITINDFAEIFKRDDIGDRISNAIKEQKILEKYSYLQQQVQAEKTVSQAKQLVKKNVL